MDARHKTDKDLSMILSKPLQSKYIIGILLITCFTTAYAIADSTSLQWSGPYIGAYLGGATASTYVKTNTGTVASTSYFITSSNIAAVNQSGSGTLKPSTGIGGIQAGYNWQSQRLIYGVVVDYGSFNLDESQQNSGAYPSSPATYTVKTSITTNWLLTARGRLGTTPTPAWPFLYATGGLATTNIRISNSFYDTADALGRGGSNNSNIKTGWVIGAGLEKPITSSLSINAEYLFADFGSVSTSGNVECSSEFCFGYASPFSTSTNNLTAQLFKVGLSYRF